MLTLAAGQLLLTLNPECGGAIASFTKKGNAVLRPVVDPNLLAQHDRSLAGYPLVPFSNRIGDGRFTWDGVQYQLARNFRGEPHTIHGNGWMHPWTVDSAGDREARLSFEHRPLGSAASEWPFRYIARERFRLHDRGLDITMEVINGDSRVMPAGLGFHPYVPCGQSTTVQFDAGYVWLSGSSGLPAEKLPVSGHWDFRQPQPIEPPKIDDCYAGWSGTVHVASGDQHFLQITGSSVLRHLVLYTPVGRDYFAVEPVSNMSNAINHQDLADNGLVSLQPGDRLEATISFAVGGT